LLACRRKRTNDLYVLRNAHSLAGGDGAESADLLWEKGTEEGPLSLSRQGA
jgi:hypothetical protein